MVDQAEFEFFLHRPRVFDQYLRYAMELSMLGQGLEHRQATCENSPTVREVTGCTLRSEWVVISHPPNTLIYVATLDHVLWTIWALCSCLLALALAWCLSNFPCFFEPVLVFSAATIVLLDKDSNFRHDWKDPCFMQSSTPLRKTLSFETLIAIPSEGFAQAWRDRQQDRYSAIHFDCARLRFFANGVSLASSEKLPGDPL